MFAHLIKRVIFDLVKPKGISINIPKIIFDDRTNFCYDSTQILKSHSIDDSDIIITRYIIIYSIYYLVCIDIIHLQN
jgi:hypothetical protein